MCIVALMFHWKQLVIIDWIYSCTPPFENLRVNIMTFIIGLRIEHFCCCVFFDYDFSKTKIKVLVYNVVL